MRFCGLWTRVRLTGTPVHTRRASRREIATFIEIAVRGLSGRTSTKGTFKAQSLEKIEVCGTGRTATTGTFKAHSLGRTEVCRKTSNTL